MYDIRQILREVSAVMTAKEIRELKDPLTGLLNKRGLEAQLLTEAEVQQRFLRGDPSYTFSVAYNGS